LRCPKRDRERARLMLQILPEYQERPRTERRAKQLLRRAAFAEGLVLYSLHLRARGQSLLDVGAWKSISRQQGLPLSTLPSANMPRPAFNSHRPRRGGRRLDRPFHNRH
jgi:hypothetical protein